MISSYYNIVPAESSKKKLPRYYFKPLLRQVASQVLQGKEFGIDGRNRFDQLF